MDAILHVLTGGNFADTIMISGVEEEPKAARQDENFILGGVDLDRITPKFFLQIPKAMGSVAKEIAGLLKINR